MKITVISDTHNQHNALGTLSGDVLIHCGDMFDLFNRNPDDIQQLDDWFGQQNFDVILCIGGNHDRPLEELLQTTRTPFKNAIYLQDQSYTHQDIVFYGAPWVPDLSRHAFYKNDREIKQKWTKIPKHVDVLITHTPPFGVLDSTSRGLRVGCENLAAALDSIVPQVHCFGHVHSSTGIETIGPTTFINASSVNSQVILERPPIIYEL